MKYLQQWNTSGLALWALGKSLGEGKPRPSLACVGGIYQTKNITKYQEKKKIALNCLGLADVLGQAKEEAWNGGPVANPKILCNDAKTKKKLPLNNLGLASVSGTSRRGSLAGRASWNLSWAILELSFLPLSSPYKALKVVRQVQKFFCFVC